MLSVLLQSFVICCSAGFHRVKQTFFKLKLISKYIHTYIYSFIKKTPYKLTDVTIQNADKFNHKQNGDQNNNKMQNLKMSKTNSNNNINTMPRNSLNYQYILLLNIAQRRPRFTKTMRLLAIRNSTDVTDGKPIGV
jgi:hypothetical protein